LKTNDGNNVTYTFPTTLRKKKSSCVKVKRSNNTNTEQNKRMNTENSFKIKCSNRFELLDTDNLIKENSSDAYNIRDSNFNPKLNSSFTCYNNSPKTIMPKDNHRTSKHQIKIFAHSHGRGIREKLEDICHNSFLVSSLIKPNGTSDNILSNYLNYSKNMTK